MRAQPDAIDVGDLPLLLSAERFARETSLSRRTVYELIRDGEIRAIRYGDGRRLMIPRDELRRFVAELEKAK